MLALALTLLLTAHPGSLSPGHELDPRGPDAPLEAPPEARAPCGGREGWVGDGEDGRDPPPCEAPDADLDDDPAGLHEPDWLRTSEDGEEDELR